VLSLPKVKSASGFLRVLMDYLLIIQTSLKRKDKRDEAWFEKHQSMGKQLVLYLTEKNRYKKNLKWSFSE
jgi:hypothetical protein